MLYISQGEKSFHRAFADFCYLAKKADRISFCRRARIKSLEALKHSRGDGDVSKSGARGLEQHERLQVTFENSKVLLTSESHTQTGGSGMQTLVNAARESEPN